MYYAIAVSEDVCRHHNVRLLCRFHFSLVSFFSLLHTDINECENANGMCEQVCLDTTGDYMCTCSSGYAPVEGNQLLCQGRYTCRYLILSVYLLAVGVRARAYCTAGHPSIQRRVFG